MRSRADTVTASMSDAGGAKELLEVAGPQLIAGGHSNALQADFAIHHVRIQSGGPNFMAEFREKKNLVDASVTLIKQVVLLLLAIVVHMGIMVLLIIGETVDVNSVRVLKMPMVKWYMEPAWPVTEPLLRNVCCVRRTCSVMIRDSMF